VDARCVIIHSIPQSLVFLCMEGIVKSRSESLGEALAHARTCNQIGDR
jgi:hypothetical protein